MRPAEVTAVAVGEKKRELKNLLLQPIPYGKIQSCLSANTHKYEYMK
jgi:hypothetical protein